MELYPQESPGEIKRRVVELPVPSRESRRYQEAGGGAVPSRESRRYQEAGGGAVPSRESRRDQEAGGGAACTLKRVQERSRRGWWSCLYPQESPGEIKRRVVELPVPSRESRRDQEEGGGAACTLKRVQERSRRGWWSCLYPQESPGEIKRRVVELPVPSRESRRDQEEGGGAACTLKRVQARSRGGWWSCLYPQESPGEIKRRVVELPVPSRESRRDQEEGGGAACTLKRVQERSRGGWWSCLYPQESPGEIKKRVVELPVPSRESRRDQEAGGGAVPSRESWRDQEAGGGELYPQESPGEIKRRVVELPVPSRESRRDQEAGGGAACTLKRVQARSRRGWWSCLYPQESPGEIKRRVVELPVPSRESRRDQEEGGGAACTLKRVQERSRGGWWSCLYPQESPGEIKKRVVELPVPSRESRRDQEEGGGAACTLKRVQERSRRGWWSCLYPQESPGEIKKR